MRVPCYCLIDGVPVKVIGEQRKPDVLAFNRKALSFRRELRLLARINAPDENVKFLSEMEFEALISQLRGDPVRAGTAETAVREDID